MLPNILVIATLRTRRSTIHVIENHDIPSDSLKICAVEPWEASWHLQLTEWGKKINKFFHTSHIEMFGFPVSFSPWYNHFQFSIVVENLHLPVAATKWRESRWKGEFGVRDFPSSVKKQSCVEYQYTSSSFLLSAVYFLSLPLQQSPVTLSASLSFLIVHPPSALFSHPSLLVTCHPLHPLLLALRLWFLSYSSSHLTSFLSSVHSFALPQGGCRRDG